VVVQLPVGYTSAADASRTYPVLEAFQGYPGSPMAWPKVFHTRQYIQSAVSAHRLRAPILVSPQVEFPTGADTEGVNGPPGSPQVETWLTRDVPDWVGQHFRVEANRNAWATIGYSAGGWVAAMATVLHPAQYGAGIVMGGYFRPDFGPFYEPFTPSDPRYRSYDLPRRVAHHPPPVSLWVQTSHADPLSYSSSAAFLRSTRAPTAVHAVVLRNAGHRISVWVALLPEALQWLGQNVSGFRP
jgi:pimeloyl-ACP methyl ester carboxylesterase